MDLSTLDTKKFAEEGQFMPLVHPTENFELKTDKDEAIGVIVRGKDSATNRKAIAKLMRKNKSKAKGKPSGEIDLDDLENQGAELIASLTVDFVNLTDDGKAVNFSHESAVALYVKYPWIAEQVRAFTDDRANFIKS